MHDGHKYILVVVIDQQTWSIDHTLKELERNHKIVVEAVRTIHLNNIGVLRERKNGLDYQVLDTSHENIVAILTWVITDARANGYRVQLCLGAIPPLTFARCLMSVQTTFDTNDQVWSVRVDEQGIAYEVIPVLRLNSLLTRQQPDRDADNNLGQREDQRRLAFYLSLPERHRRVVRLVLDCLNNREIGGRLYVAACVVAARLTEIYELLQNFGSYDPDKRVNRLDLMQFFGDFFKRHPDLAE